LIALFAEAHEALGLYADAIKYIEENDKGGFASALARIRQARGTPTVSGGAEPTSDIVRYVARCQGRVPQYLIDRGIAQADIKRWRIGYDEQLQRAVFPIWDETSLTWRCKHCGRLSESQEACCGEEEGMAHYPKYHDTYGLPKDRVFYGEHLIDTTRNRVYIVEGILDAVFASRVLPNVVALMGANTGIGPERMRKLRNWCGAVTLVLDADTAGDNAWAGWTDERGRHHPGLREKLRQHFPVRVAHLPPGEDPASVSPVTLRTAVNEASYLSA
jgi:DNA primase